MAVITFRWTPCNRIPLKPKLNNRTPLRPKNAIISSSHQNFLAPSAPENPLYTLFFAFCCSFKKQSLRKVTFRNTFRNQPPKTLSGKITYSIYLNFCFLLHCQETIFPKNHNDFQNGAFGAGNIAIVSHPQILRNLWKEKGCRKVKRAFLVTMHLNVSKLFLNSISDVFTIFI